MNLLKEWRRKWRKHRHYKQLRKIMERNRRDAEDWDSALKRFSDAQGLPTPKAPHQRYLENPGPYKEKEVNE